MVLTRWTLVAGVVVLVGCSVSQQEPRTAAIQQAARCSGESSAAARLLGPASVERVEPLYGIVYSTPNGQESRLLGASLHLRALDGATAESMTHALYCHAAAEVLHGDDASPYWIPDGWVNITVKYDGGSYVVNLEGHDFGQANEILTRARAFARN